MSEYTNFSTPFPPSSSIGLTIIAVFCHFFLGRKTFLGHLLSFLLNTIGAGFSASAYYTVKAVNCRLDLLAWGLIPAALLMLVVSLLMVVLRENKHILTVVFALVEVGLIITSIVFWVKLGGEIFANMFFSLVLASFYIAVLAVTVDSDERTTMRDCSFGSYGFYLVVTVVVIAILLGAMGCDDCSCDGCDCSGCCDCDTSSNNKKKIK